MKKLLTFLLMFCTVLTIVGQNGINYKAVVKDSNGDVLANQNISIQFTIYEGAALTNNVYQEDHTSVATNANGLIILNIGEGNSNNNLEDVDWKKDEHFLNVQIDTGSGLIDMGTTAFKAVPYAHHAFNVNGLGALDEGNGIGWRLLGINPDNYGNIGQNSIDLSINNTFNNNNGAVGQDAFTSGRFTTANGGSTTAMGRGTQAESFNSTAIGSYNIGGGNPNNWVPTDPLFEIGNHATGILGRSNALTVFKNGQHLIQTYSSNIEYGLKIISFGDGAVIEASDTGLVVEGNQAGITASAIATNSEDIDINPDIILGGKFGRIYSDPGDNDSGIRIKSNSDIIFDLDDDAAGPGFNYFRINSPFNPDFSIFSVHTSGQVQINNSVVHSSDKRLKEDIEELVYGLNEVLQLNPKQYFWKGKDHKRKSLGLIAQDIQTIISEIVVEGNDEQKMLSVNYIELIPVLINAIKEQQGTIDNLNNRLLALEALATNN
ncbi:tail fiber domain-containing protein [uncultured Psychroserpens sp.]|uniref:tail fiber domain-containing protein n=1 Tax=uncultured Psychroserpens sp. TaxID=255436 RepID=UPI00261BECFB|nr:tail fiber domain-containing protein [uncultured Psychroserpens sp.]